MRWRPLIAILLTPALASAVPLASYWMRLSGSLNADEWIQIAGWAVFAIVFEVLVLLPLTRLLRSRTHFQLRLLCAGAVAWLLLSMAWFAVVFNLPFRSLLAPALLMGLAGSVFCAAFAFLWGPPPQPSRPAA
jgi:hypothetical protein